MITFACPSCSRAYRVSPENAKKRTRCTQCRAPLVVPDLLDLAGEDLHDSPHRPADGPGTTLPPASESLADTVAPKASWPEPPAYQSAERYSSFLANTNRVVSTIAAGLCLVGCWIAFDERKAGSLVLPLLVAAVAFGLSIVVSELVHQLVLVFLDHARNGRAVRNHLTRGR